MASQNTHHVDPDSEAGDPTTNADRTAGDQQPKVTQIILVRHGKTSTTGSILPGRTPGLYLSEEGIAQAESVAAGLKAELLNSDAKETPEIHLFASPLERTQQTAEPISQALNLPIQTLDDILEADFGEWTGQELAELRKLPEWKQVQESPSTFRFPGGESFLEMQTRVVSGLERVKDAHPGAVLICVSHADVIKCAMAHFLGMGLDDFQRLFISPCSRSEIAFTENGHMVMTMNSLSGNTKREDNG